MSNVTRRTMIRLGGQGFFAVVATLPLLGCAPTGKRSSPVVEVRSWERFIEQVAKLAERQVDPAWDQVAYTAQVQAMLSELDLTDRHLKDAVARYRNAHRNFPEINPLHREQNFMVSLLEFEPGERIELHDHPDMTGCILCSEGEINVQNYTLDKRVSERGRPLLRAASALTMTPGTTGSLTATTANIHALQAVTFTRLIDVFTPPYNAERTQRSRWYVREPKPYPLAPDCYEATVRA